jgi:hypothetical protein
MFFSLFSCFAIPLNSCGLDNRIFDLLSCSVHLSLPVRRQLDGNLSISYVELSGVKTLCSMSGVRCSQSEFM